MTVLSSHPHLDKCLAEHHEPEEWFAVFDVLKGYDPTAIELAEQLLSSGPSAARKATRDGVRRITRSIARAISMSEGALPAWQEDAEVSTPAELRNTLRADWAIGEAEHRIGGRYHHSRWLSERMSVRAADQRVSGERSREEDVERMEYWVGLALIRWARPDTTRLTDDASRQRYRELVELIGGLPSGPALGAAFMEVRERGILDAETLTHVLKVRSEAISPLSAGAL